MGRTVTECIRRSGMSGRWYFVAFTSTVDRMDPALGQNNPRAHESDPFIYQENTEYRWDVRTGLVSLHPVPPEGSN